MSPEPFWLNRGETREFDLRAMQEFGIPCLVLMENAGRSAAECMMELNPEKELVTLLCGPGNNGGDGFVMARHLENHGYPVKVWLLAPAVELAANAPKVGIHPHLSLDCDINYHAQVRSEFEVVYFDTRLTELSVWQEQVVQMDIVQERGWIVDALYGSGLTRPLESPMAEVISAVNISGRPVLSIDLPSGLDCDTGEPLGPTIKAHHTVTFVAWKKGFLNPQSHRWVGEIHVGDVGAPKRLVDQFRKLRATD